MTVLDTKLVPLSYDLIQKYGKTTSYTVYTRTPDPTTGNVTVSTKVYTVKISPPTKYEDAYYNKDVPIQSFRKVVFTSDVIRAGDMQTFLPAKGLLFTPQEADQITIDSRAWKVLGVKSIYTGDSIALYELHLTS